MSLRVSRPWVVGGIGLVAGAWVLEGLHPAALGWGETALWGTLALSAGTWLLRQRKRVSLQLEPSVAPLDRATVERSLSAIEPLIGRLATELPTDDVKSAALIAGLQNQLSQLKAQLDRKVLRLALAGGKAVGKTTLVSQLTSHWKSDAAAEFTLEDALTAEASAAVTTHADAVLFVTTGDLTDSELQTIQAFVKRQQRVVLVFNKQDQYLPPDRPLLLQQLRERVQQLLPLQDVVAIAAAPTAFKVRQHQPDGTVQERLEQPTPDLADLMERLADVVANTPQLTLATVQRQAEELRQEVQTTLNQVRRDRALPLIEQAQWIAAGAAFATPVPSLDLLATAAINAQLVTDLGAIYQQKFSVEREQTIAGTLAELMVKLGLVELSSQAIAPLLKSNALTFVAGGLLQGISAAYLTRIAGLALVAYFEEQSSQPELGANAQLQLDRLTQKLKAVFQDNQRTAFVQALVKQGISRLAPMGKAPLANPTA